MLYDMLTHDSLLAAAEHQNKETRERKRVRENKREK